MDYNKEIVAMKNIFRCIICVHSITKFNILRITVVLSLYRLILMPQRVHGVCAL